MISVMLASFAIGVLLPFAAPRLFALNPEAHEFHQRKDK